MPPSPSSRNSGRRGGPKKLLGKTEPRLWTPPLRPLNRRTSLGYECADFADAIGSPMLPWQRWATIHALELNPDRSYRFRVVLILVGRQNGKSSLKRTVSLWRLYMDGAQLVLGVAQDVALAREQWNMCIDTIKDNPDLEAELDKESRRNGDEWFRVKSGGRYKISAANRSAGRGLSVDELNIDELREWRSWDPWSALFPTTMARPRAQIWCITNAGDDQSVVLNRLREQGIAGTDPSIGLFEWSAEDGCDLDDVRQWQQSNPGLGYTVSEDAIRIASHTDPPNVFRTEVLCQKVDAIDGAVDLAAWRDCTDATGTMESLRKSVCAGFDIAPDGQHATLAVAAQMPDGRVRVEIVAAWDTTDVARRELPALLDRIRPQGVAWFPTGPGGSFATLLRGRRGSSEMIGMRMAEACQGLADLAAARAVVHPGDPLLDAHIGRAQKVPFVDGWRFGRRDVGHVDAAYAAAGAIKLAQELGPGKHPRIRMLA